MRAGPAKTGIDYQSWARRGLLNATPGSATDFDIVEADILKMANVFNIETLGFDPMYARQMVSHLMERGLDCVEIRQGMMTLAPPTAELQRLVVSSQIVHGGHEVLNWNIANTVVAPDAAGNIKPHKGKSANKIDGTAALINAMALGMAVRQSGSIDAFLSRPVMSA